MKPPRSVIATLVILATVRVAASPKWRAPPEVAAAAGAKQQAAAQANNKNGEPVSGGVAGRLAKPESESQLAAPEANRGADEQERNVAGAKVSRVCSNQLAANGTLSIGATISCVATIARAQVDL